MSGLVRLMALRPLRRPRARSLAALACALSLAACGSSSKSSSPPHPGIHPSTAALLTTEGGSNASFTVSLGAPPSSSVTLDVTSNDATEGELLGPGDTTSSSWTTLTFTPVNWNVPQTVQVVPQRDYVADGSVTYTVTTSVSWTTDMTYLALPPVTLSVTNADADIPVVALSKTTATTSENGTTDSFAVVLGTQPSATVTLPVTSLDTTEGLVRGGSSPSTSQPSVNLTFTTWNWNVPQTVTVYGQNDNVADGNQTYAVQVGAATGAAEYAALGAQTVQVTNQDNDVAGVSVIAAASPLVTSENGATATFTVKLNTEPTADVVVPVTSGNAAEGLLSSGTQNLQATVNLTFTGGPSGNWNAPQTVTVTGQDDTATPVPGDNVTYAVTVGAPTGAAEYLAVAAQSVSVLNLDNDTPAFIVPQAGGTALQTSESGTTATFTVWLNRAPTANVTIPVTSGDSTEGLVKGGSYTTAASTITLTFTTADWQVPQTVTVVGQPDVVVDGNQPYAITVGPTSSTDTGFNALAAKTVSVTNADTNTAGFTVSTTSLSTTEGGSVTTFTVRLNTQPFQNVTIPVSSGDATEGLLMGGDSAGAYLSSINLTFTPASWQTPQTISVKGPLDYMQDGGQYYTITVGPTASSDTPYQGLGAKTISAYNYDVDTAGFTVTPTSGLVTTEAGGTATFTVKLATIPTGTVNVPVSVDDTSEAFVSAGGTPSGYLSLAFDSSNWNVAQTVTVTGQPDGILDGNRPFVVSVGPTNSGDAKYNNLTAKTVGGSNTDAQSGVSQGTVILAATSLPYAGQCGTGTTGTSYYQITGLTPGAPALVSLLNATAAVTLTVDDDGNYSTGNLCSASVAAFASGSCTATVPGSGTLWVRVSSAASGGAGYTLNVPVGTVYTSSDVPKAIPDGSYTGATSAITVSGGATAISKVTVTLSIVYPYDYDLRLYLISPAGTEVLLSWERGGTGANYANTVFDDAAATSITAGSAPFTGTFRPEGVLSTLAGQNANGTWQLKVVDAWTGGTGSITAFGLSIW